MTEPQPPYSPFGRDDERTTSITDADAALIIAGGAEPDAACHD